MSLKFSYLKYKKQLPCITKIRKSPKHTPKHACMHLLTVASFPHPDKQISTPASPHYLFPRGIKQEKWVLLSAAAVMRSSYSVLLPSGHKPM